MPKTKDAPPVAGPAPGEIVMLSVDQVSGSIGNYRKHRDPKADADLCESIKTHGLLQAILVKRISGGYNIIAGNRRFDAAKAAGLKEIRSVVLDVTDEQGLEIQLVENLQREDAHPMDEAEAFSVLIRKKYGLDDISMKVNKPRGYIVRTLQLLKLDPKIRTAFLKDQLDIDHAFQLCRLQPADQKQAFEACFDFQDDDSGKKSLVSGQQLRGWISQNLFRDLSRVPWDVKDGTLIPKAGSCVACPKRTGNQPDLFGQAGVKLGDTCTDLACFSSKRDAFVKKSIDEGKKSGTPLLQLSEHYKSQKAGLVGTDGYRELQEKQGDCPDTKSGILVEAWNDRVGEMKRVCTAARCKIHTTSAGAGSDPAVRAATRNVIRETEFERASRKTLLMAILQTIRSVPTRKDLELIADSLLTNLHQDHRIIACDLFGWVDELRTEWEAAQSKHKPKKGHLKPRFSPDLLAHAALRLKTMDDQQLCRFIAACSLADTIHGPRWCDDQRDVLIEAAQVRGIDAKDIFKEVRRDLDAKWKVADEKKTKKAPKKPVKDASCESGACTVNLKPGGKKGGKAKADRAKVSASKER